MVQTSAENVWSVLMIHIVAMVYALPEPIDTEIITNFANLTKTRVSSSDNKYQISSNGAKKECVMNVNETDLVILKRLVQSKVFHYVELNLHFASSISNSVIKEWQWRMTNDVGKEILSLLTLEYICVSYTLDVGTQTRHLNVTDAPSGCISSEKDPGELIAKTIMKQLPPEKEMCFQEVLNMSTQTRCCKTIGKDPFKYDCRVSFARSDFVNVLKSMLSVNNIFERLAWFPLVVYIGLFLQWKSTTDTEGFYKLAESPMSLSSILTMLFWDGYGRIKSFVRRCLLIGALFILFWQMKSFDELNYFKIYFSIWALLYPFFNFFVQSDVTSEWGFFLSRYCQKVFSHLHYNIDDVLLLGQKNVLGAVCLITLPFNIKRWKRMFSHFRPKKDDLEKRSGLNKIGVYSKKGAFCLGTLLLVFLLQIVFVFLFTADCYSLIVIKQGKAIINRRGYSIVGCSMILCEIVCLFFTVFFLLYALEYIPCIAISLLSGLLLNVVYFFPYVVLSSILLSYFWIFWSHVEEQYVVLMTLIFAENVKYNVEAKTQTTTLATAITTTSTITTTITTTVTPGTTTTTPGNDDDKAGGENDDRRFKCETCRNDSVVDIDDLTETVCVVSEELYDSIRKRLLPYHGNLFRFALNILGIFVFAVISLTLVKVLQASDVSPTIQLFTTFSVGAFPYIMNVVAAKKGEKQKNAWEKQLKHCVEPLVKKIAGDKADLRRTEFIITHQDQNVEEGRESVV